ncbi:hypothetical protein QE408_002665 [Agrobacterium larrymoorei]|uniref:Two-component sensor histidine kinase n=1 Tax=Agrobacterium larrymoorei TaxID=160699 RepID=A0ABU0UKN1_9HYPH|nr:hypothetical protein [Agrobacterium larrymoorei]
MPSRLRLLFSSTAVRLSALYILLFALCAAFLVFYVTALSERLLNQQTRDAVLQEVNDVQRIYERGGINPLLRMMERRARQPGASLYVIAGPNGEILAGNVASVQPGVFDSEGWTEFPFTYERYSESGDSVKHLATANIFVLDNGLRILIGRDLGEPTKFRLLVRNALMVAPCHHGRRRLDHLVCDWTKRAEAARPDVGCDEEDYGGRSVPETAARPFRRRVRSSFGLAQCHVGAHRKAE